MLRISLLSITVGVLLSHCTGKKYQVVIHDARVVSHEIDTIQAFDVAVNADTIAAIAPTGSLKGDREVNAHGLVLAPGFIDTHSHHDRGLRKNPDADAALSQGITTIIVGQDGASEFPLHKYFQALKDSPVSVNVGSYCGHNTLRDRVMKNDFKRKATQKEIDTMAAMLRTDMEAGAFGLSTGLEYDPGIYSDHDEVLQLSKVLPHYGGRYISHLRSEDRYFWSALQEIITIGKEVQIPVQISHFKLAMRSLFGKADSALHILDEARNQGVMITADLYPYTYWSSTIRVLFPGRNFSSENEAAFILKEVTSPGGIVLSNYDPNPEFNGKTLAEVSIILKKSPEKTLIELIERLDDCDKKKGDCAGSIVATSMDEDDVKKLMKWGQTNICSDGASSGRHPRGFGAFTRVLGKYTREEKTLTLRQAVDKMTLLAAAHLGIRKRGEIKVGNYADLVLFDPEKVRDQSTIIEPQKMSEGIVSVWVNGQEAFASGKATGKHNGKIIIRE